jgi:hypothetical protein
MTHKVYGGRFLEPVRCAAPGCSKLARWRPLSNYCDLHRYRVYLTGTHMPPPTDRELARHRQPIAHALRIHRDTQAVQAAVNLVVRDLLKYRATTQLTMDTFTQRKMSLLRDAGVVPLDILQRVTEVYSLRFDDEPSLKYDRAFHTFLARKVLQLKRGVVQHDGNQPNAKHLSYLGEQIATTVGRFSVAVLMLVKKMREERKAFDGVCEDLMYARSPKIPRVRHGRTHARPSKVKALYKDPAAE